LATPSLIRKDSLTFVGSFMLIMTIGLMYSLVFRWICTCIIAIYASFRAVGGLDKLELLLHSDMVINYDKSEGNSFLVPSLSSNKIRRRSVSRDNLSVNNITHNSN
jgi:hypothetical protein